MVCADALSMSLGSVANANIATMAFQDDLCSMDYIGIEGKQKPKVDIIQYNGIMLQLFISYLGSADTCNQSGVTGATTNRFCGMFLNTVQVGQNIPICDCTSPFQVDIVTDAVADNTNGANTISRSRGERIETIAVH